MKQEKPRLQKSISSLTVLLTIFLILQFVSTNKEFIEKYYSTSVYPEVSTFLRMLTAWIPFSLGDVIFIIAIIYCLGKIVHWCYLIFQKKITVYDSLLKGIKSVRAVLLIYIMFLLLWGLNYKRSGITSQLRFKKEDYTTERLKSLTADLVKAVNASYFTSNMYLFQFESDIKIFEDAVMSYKNVSYQYPFLNYNQPCIKSGLISKVYNYCGIAGYCNPFTAEAQINSSIPRFLRPYIVSHEIAHQLGYATEEEANFVAYLVSKNSYENAFKYSAYFTLFNYANKQLYFRDSVSAKINFNALDSLVKKDEATYLKYIHGSSSEGGHYSTKIYNYYLQINNQPKGIDSYTDVIALLIAYQKKYGEL